MTAAAANHVSYMGRDPWSLSETWLNPRAIAEVLDSDGFFRSGGYDPGKNSFHILGRAASDIIKCGGHNISSLQIERDHATQSLEDAVVFGVPDEVYGERVGLITRLIMDLTLLNYKNGARKEWLGIKYRRDCL